MARFSKPLTKEAKKHLESKLDRMGKIEREKTTKRLEKYDRGYRVEKYEEML